MNTVGILLIIIALIMIYPFFGELIVLDQDEVEVDISFSEACFISIAGDDCGPINDQITDTLPNFYTVKKLFIVGYSLIIISIFMSFYNPAKRFLFIPVILAGIVCLIAPIILLNSALCLGTGVCSNGYRLGSIVQFTGAGLAIALGAYCLAFKRA